MTWGVEYGENRVRHRWSKEKGQQTNNGLRPSLHKLFGISKLINFFTKLAYFKQKLWKKFLLNWQIFSAQQFSLGWKTGSANFYAFRIYDKGWLWKPRQKLMTMRRNTTWTILYFIFERVTKRGLRVGVGDACFF